MAGLAGALLMLLLVGLIWLWRGGQNPLAPSATETPAPAHTAVQPTWTAAVFTQIVVVTATPEPATATPAASETLPPPTNTAAPTDTPMPTGTATPAFALPFEDNFDDGLRPEWVVTDGEFVIINGWLAATDHVSLLVGDASLTDYVLELDYDSIYYNYLIEVYFARLLRLELFYYAVTWQTNEGLGSPTWYTQGQELAEAGPRGHLRVEVRGNSATTYIHGQQVDARTFNQPLAGPLVIELPETDAMIDNVRISAP